MPDDAGVPDPTTGQVVMPNALNLSSASIVPYGLYRWIGRDAVPALLADVFGVEDRTQLKQGKTSLPLLDNEYSERVRAGKSIRSIIVPAKY
jgi:protein transport protein SEC24